MPRTATGSTTPGWAPVLVAGALVLLMAAVYLLQCHERAEVWLSTPLDDTFIHFQYAKQLARGHVLQFNDGDSPTTGATSLLYIILLAPGWLVGFRGLNLLIWSWLLNGALFAVAGAALFSVVLRLTRQRALAYTGMAVFLLNGHMLWGVFSQMEIALFTALLLGTLEAALRLAPEPGPGEDQEQAAGDSPGALRRLLVLGSLLAWCRPEGAMLAGGLSLWLLWRHLGGWRRGAEPLRRRLRSALPLLAPLASAAALVLLFLLLTGRVGTNASLKSHLLLLSGDLGAYIGKSIDWLPRTYEILLGIWPPLAAPLIAVLLLLGLGGWAAAGRLRRPGSGALVLLWMALLVLFYALLMASREHFDRYYLPYYGLTVVACWWGLGRFAEVLPRLRQPGAVVGAMVLVLMAPHTHFWSRRYGDNCRDLAQQHFEVAKWLQRNTPAGSRIAVNDAGAIPYLSERHTYDIVGLAHNDFYRLKKAINYTNAPVWEALEELRHPPDYMVAYPEWIPDLHGLRVFQPLKRFPLLKRTMVANNTKVVWRMSWDLLADSSTPPARLMGGRKLADRLDVANLAHERRHGYSLLDEQPPRGFVRQQALDSRVLIEGGRQVLMGERFTLSARPGRPAALLMRTAGPGALDLDLSLDGRKLGRWTARLPADFSVQAFTIPGPQVRGRSVELKLVARRQYTSFHYWLVQ